MSTGHAIPFWAREEKPHEKEETREKKKKKKKKKKKRRTRENQESLHILIGIELVLDHYQSFNFVPLLLSCVFFFYLPPT